MPFQLNTYKFSPPPLSQASSSKGEGLQSLGAHHPSFSFMEKEKESSNDGIVTTAGNSAPLPPPDQVPPAKKHRRWSLFRAALFVVRRGGQPDKMKGPPTIHAYAPDSPAKSHSIWRSLFCGMRPLLLQPPQLVKHELFHDTALPPPSPAFSDNGMSRYASAEDLQALDKGNKKDEGEEDPTIDVRAEEFIARFYEQMRLQRLGSRSDQDD